MLNIFFNWVLPNTYICILDFLIRCPFIETQDPYSWNKVTSTSPIVVSLERDWASLEKKIEKSYYICTKSFINEKD